ncbi:hypothetical protein ACFQ1X_02305 [Metaplanococcus flavidus]|uniref:Uncharacterized protein n=2 Tax=Metaplanococcus flavidus TaxID=569883 RepID=A0ABW3L8Q5_9BACL
MEKLQITFLILSLLSVILLVGYTMTMSLIDYPDWLFVPLNIAVITFVTINTILTIVLRRKQTN